MTTTPYYRTGAYRSATSHPFHVHTYTDWKSDPSTVVGFQAEAEARRYAASRPEPIIDLVQRDRGVVASRRMLPHPDMLRVGHESYMTDAPGPRDDFPQLKEK